MNWTRTIGRSAFGYDPVTHHKNNDSQGITDAHLLCQYYSRVYHLSRFEELPPLLREAVRISGHHYEQNLRYPGSPSLPGSLNADTPAQQQQTKSDRDQAIR